MLAASFGDMHTNMSNTNKANTLNPQSRLLTLASQHDVDPSVVLFRPTHSSPSLSNPPFPLILITPREPHISCVLSLVLPSGQFHASARLVRLASQHHSPPSLSYVILIIHTPRIHHTPLLMRIYNNHIQRYVVHSVLTTTRTTVF